MSAPRVAHLYGPRIRGLLEALATVLRIHPRVRVSEVESRADEEYAWSLRVSRKLALVGRGAPCVSVHVVLAETRVRGPADKPGGVSFVADAVTDDPKTIFTIFPFWVPSHDLEAVAVGWDHFMTQFHVLDLSDRITDRLCRGSPARGSRR